LGDEFALMLFDASADERGTFGITVLFKPVGVH